MTSLKPTTESHHGKSWEWWLAALAASVAAGFGAYGLWIYEVTYGERADIWSVAYHTLQLFILHAPHLEHPVPWELNLGRWLSAVIVLGALARGLLTVFRSECRLLWARMRRGHVVICGLGRLGMQLAREFRGSGWRVVAIEADGSPGQIAAAQEAGVAVITGDACISSTLERAAVTRASKVIAVCDDVQKNVAISARVGELLVGPRSSVECWMFISDPTLRQVFQQEYIFPNTGEHYKVNVRGLDLFELASRQVLRKAPIDYERIKSTDPTVVHLVVVGFGSMGTQLALQSAKIAHFANFRKPRVTVVEREGSTRADNFLARHPKFNQICDFSLRWFSPQEGQPDPNTVIHALPLAEQNELITVAVCWDSDPRDLREDGADFFRRLDRDDATNLSLALSLARSPATAPQIYVFQTRRVGFGALFPIEGRGQAVGHRVHAFGMLEDTCSLEALLHEREDSIAKVLHNDYYEKQIKQGRKPGDRPALFPWDRLPERFRDSNRRAADHIRVKMRALGYRIDEKRKDQPSITSFEGEQIELLARMEHESWCAEWLLQNYSYAPGERDDVAKTQPYLVAWDKLDKSVQDWDYSQVRAIPNALIQAGYGIYSQVR
jgi:voltage-gated potassium channel Kch